MKRLIGVSLLSMLFIKPCKADCIRLENAPMNTMGTRNVIESFLCVDESEANRIVEHYKDINVVKFWSKSNNKWIVHVPMTETEASLI